MTERILKGPFLTRSEAARRGHIRRALLPHRPDLLHLGGEWLEEVYFAFQFDDHGVRPEIGLVVQELKKTYSDVAIADWLVRANPALNDSTPLGVLAWGSTQRVLSAADVFGPEPEEALALDQADVYLQAVRAIAPEEQDAQARATRSRSSSSKKRISPSGMRIARSGVS